VKSAPFAYRPPETLEEEARLRAEWAPQDHRVLTGGQRLVPMMNFRLAPPAYQIDIMFAVQAQASAIRTVEGLAQGNNCTLLQRALMIHHGVQCGFCTPGFLMLATAVLERAPDIGDEALLDVLASDLCRCTGYRGIVAGICAAIAELRSSKGPA
jgi:hypothetical protein